MEDKERRKVIGRKSNLIGELHTRERKVKCRRKKNREWKGEGNVRDGRDSKGQTDRKEGS